MVDLTEMNGLKSPFPIAHKDGIIVDEMCACGALRSEHVSDNMSWRHGGCEKTMCQRFTWKHFVFAPKG